MRLVVGSVILNGGGIKRHHVRKIAFAQATAIGQRQGFRRESAEATDGLLGRDDFLGANIFGEHAAEIPVSARMLARQKEDPFGRRRVGIGSEADPGQSDLTADVVFRHQEIGDAHSSAVFDDQLHSRFVRTHAAHTRHFVQRLAHQRFECRVLESQQQGALGAGALQKIFPGRRGVAHFFRDTRAHRWVLQSLSPLVVAALLHPRRHGRIQAGGTCRVGIHVGRDADSRGARRLDFLDHGIELVPVRLTRHLEMIDLRRRSRLFGNGDRLLHCFDEAIAFTAHVRYVHAAATS